MLAQWRFKPIGTPHRLSLKHLFENHPKFLCDLCIYREPIFRQYEIRKNFKRNQFLDRSRCEEEKLFPLMNELFYQMGRFTGNPFLEFKAIN